MDGLRILPPDATAAPTPSGERQNAPGPDAVLFLDWDNIHLSLGRNTNLVPDVAVLCGHAQTHGRLVIGHA